MKIINKNRTKAKISVSWLLILTIVLFCACGKQTTIFATDKDAGSITTDEQNQDNPLKKLLAEASWDSINEAKSQGKAALPVIKPFLENENYQVRQMAVASAGAIGDDEASEILSAGLKDSNINVRLAAAKELSKQAYPSATETVLEVLKTSPDETVREFLVKSAGYLPGEKTISMLRPLAKSKSGKNFIADQAIYSLAKLGDSTGINLVNSRLSASLPRTRYETLQNLCYIDDQQFAPTAKKLLSDKAEAIRVGSVKNPQMRRVADAAVDSLVCLLKLELPFRPSKNLYTDDEINQVRNLAN